MAREASMTSAAYDITFLTASAADLNNYLLSNELYWPLNLRNLKGERPYPRMTLGWILLSQTRLNARDDLLDTQHQELRSASSKIATLRSRWLSAWRAKAQQEFAARLKLWAQFMNDLKTNRSVSTERYAFEVQRRVMLGLLKLEIPETDDQRAALLSGMDGYLRGVLKSGPFVWDAELTGGFSAPAYWYLFGQLTG